MNRRLILIVLGMMCLSSVACTTHYCVHDPSTGKDYYTTKIKRKSSGAVDLIDQRTGARVVLQTSEVAEVTARQYNNAIRDVD